ncbi:MAG: PQ-loop domain-containing transporter [Pseudomonadota bacterium]
MYVFSVNGKRITVNGYWPSPPTSVVDHRYSDRLLSSSGALVLCASALPQIIKTYKTKSAADLSILYLFVLAFGIVLMQTYSIYTGDFVSILGNTLSLMSTVILIVLWFRYRK